MKLQNSIAIVTGGSRGIGRAIATEFANEGAKVIVNYLRSDAAAKKLESELKGKGLDVSLFKADISKDEDVKKLINYAVDTYGSIDILVNNAGIVSDKNWDQKTVEEWNNLLNTRLETNRLMLREWI